MIQKIVLGIESSCDETAASVYSSSDGVLSNVLFSQIELHKLYGGVVPEIASRTHLEKINSIVQKALDDANVTLDSIDIIGVTNKPGLPGSLLVGLCFAKALACVKQKKIIGVNHLEGHIFSSFIENDVPFPHLCITASGGHTSMYLVNDFDSLDQIGQTLDDAAGEAFDKISKILGLGYPGGPILEKLAEQAQFQDFFKYPRLANPTTDFSFSGLKTAVIYDLVKRKAYDLEKKQFLLESDEKLKSMVASSLLVCITDIFQKRIEIALKHHRQIKALTFVGGVACNKYIKNRLQQFANERDLKFFWPSPQYCTDNAAMIAYIACKKAEKFQYSNLDLDIY